ncbi:MAG: 50S ribosomal protein L15 [Verrucomicrobiota bacterium]|nr:50S ribosomal protein L15 [Verrucomicrobiota bacterium]
MKLYTLKNTDKRQSRKRIGRGDASGYGKTAGRGENGYGSRSGSKKRSYFEGGQLPLFRRLPKRGFKNFNRKEYTIINLKTIERSFEGTEEKIDKALLVSKGLINDRDNAGLKVLADGEITKPFTIVAQKFTVATQKKVEAAGGTCQTI